MIRGASSPFQGPSTLCAYVSILCHSSTILFLTSPFVHFLVIIHVTLSNFSNCPILFHFFHSSVFTLSSFSASIFLMHYQGAHCPLPSAPPSLWVHGLSSLLLGLMAPSSAQLYHVSFFRCCLYFSQSIYYSIYIYLFIFQLL